MNFTREHAHRPVMLVGVMIMVVPVRPVLFIPQQTGVVEVMVMAMVVVLML